jgi:hypothetical protein
MDLDAIVQSLDAEISRLEKIRALLAGHTAPPKPARKRGRMSAEGRKLPAGPAGRVELTYNPVLKAAF